MSPMKRVEFKEKVENRDIDGYIIFSDVSAWIWVGNKDVDSIGLAHFPLFTMLVDGENTQREFIKSIALRLTKKSRFEQVFFTTDIECEEGIFWQQLHERLSSKLNEIAETS